MCVYIYIYIYIYTCPKVLLPGGRQAVFGDSLHLLLGAPRDIIIILVIILIIILINNNIYIYIYTNNNNNNDDHDYYFLSIYSSNDVILDFEACTCS